MAKIIIEGFVSLKDAKEFEKWYSGAGEQESSFWQEEHSPESNWYLDEKNGLRISVEED